MDNWEQTLREALTRMADGDVSDDDVEFIMANLPVVGDNLQQWLQELVDEPKEVKNVRLLLSLLALYDLYKAFD